MNLKQDSHQSGMTLIEVLVALAIVSVAVLALARSGGQALDTQYELEQRTLAMWVADHVLAQIELGDDAVPGQRVGEMTMANRTWFWRAVIQPTPDQAMLRVDVVIEGRGDARGEGVTPIIVQTGFVSS